MIDTLAVVARGGGAMLSAPANILSSLAVVYATHFNEAPLQ